MSKSIVSTPYAPTAIGPYSQAVVYDQLIFCSGQIALDPKSGNLTGTTTADQTKQVMENLGAVLEAAGAGWNNVLKCTIYLADMDDFMVVNEIYAGYFKENKPAREAVAVKTLPKNAKVEISCMAHR